MSKGRPKNVRHEIEADRKDNANTAKKQANKADLVQKMKDKIKGQ
ncbi:hypothetical protein [Streptomyces inhibens]|nr:hypothetical protein [Streptomyces inhibens]